MFMTITLLRDKSIYPITMYNTFFDSTYISVYGVNYDIKKLSKLYQFHLTLDNLCLHNCCMIYAVSMMANLVG